MRCVQSMISCGLFLALLPACVEIGVHELDDGFPEDTAPANSDTGLDTGVGFDSEESDSGNSDTGEPFDSGQTDTGEPDPGEPGVAIVSFESQQVLEIREGSSRNLTVRVTGASVPLDAFRVSFLVAGSASGPSGQAADAADFRVCQILWGFLALGWIEPAAHETPALAAKAPRPAETETPEPSDPPIQNAAMSDPDLQGLDATLGSGSESTPSIEV